MNADEQIEVSACATNVRRLQVADSGHDWLHIERVWKLANTIACAENADEHIVALAALTHDLDDHKFRGADEVPYAKLRIALQHVSGTVQEQVIHIVSQISWSKGARMPDSLEACIVQDADRLDAIGAIGVARTFGYGGHKGYSFYERSEGASLTPGFSSLGDSTIAHFAQKLLLLKDFLHTGEARRIAVGRHDFMVAYVAQLRAEVEGKR